MLWSTFLGYRPAQGGLEYVKHVTTISLFFQAINGDLINGQNKVRDVFLPSDNFKTLKEN